MFVLPDALIHLLGRLTYLSDIRGIIPDQLLQVFLSSEWPIHIRDVFLLPKLMRCMKVLTSSTGLPP